VNNKKKVGKPQSQKHGTFDNSRAKEYLYVDILNVHALQPKELFWTINDRLGKGEVFHIAEKGSQENVKGKNATKPHPPKLSCLDAVAQHTTF
jgi:hypothetical protein